MLCDSFSCVLLRVIKPNVLHNLTNKQASKETVLQQQQNWQVQQQLASLELRKDWPREKLMQIKNESCHTQISNSTEFNNIRVCLYKQ